MRHLDLFAGIGGFSRAVEWLGGETVGFVEWESWNRRVLAKHWPEARFFSDIKTVTNDDLRELGRIDLITGGYPCQPFSLAGQRRGAEDDRHLWPEMRRVIEATRPRFVLAENVAGHISMGLDTVLSDLEADGYTCGAVVVPAGAVNALHRRDRVWILAHRNDADANGERQPQPEGIEQDERGWAGDVCEGLAHAGSDGSPRSKQPRADCPEGFRAIRVWPGASRCGEGMAHAAARGLRRGSAPGQAGQPACGGEGVGDTYADADRAGRGAHQRERASLHEQRLRLRNEPCRAGDVQRLGAEQEHEASRPVDAGVDGLRAGLVRRPATRPADIRAAWADGSWEIDLPRVVTDEPERRQKLMAAGNAIVPLVAYEILRVMIGGAE